MLSVTVLSIFDGTALNFLFFFPKEKTLSLKVPYQLICNHRNIEKWYRNKIQISVIQHVKKNLQAAQFPILFLDLISPTIETLGVHHSMYIL